MHYHSDFKTISQKPSGLTTQALHSLKMEKFQIYQCTYSIILSSLPIIDSSLHRKPRIRNYKFVDHLEQEAHVGSCPVKIKL